MCITVIKRRTNVHRSEEYVDEIHYECGVDYGSLLLQLTKELGFKFNVYIGNDCFKFDIPNQTNDLVGEMSKLTLMLMKIAERTHCNMEMTNAYSTLDSTKKLIFEG